MAWSLEQLDKLVRQLQGEIGGHISDFVRTLLDDDDAATARSTLGAAPLLIPAVRAFMFTGTFSSIANGASPALPFDAESYDTDNMHNTSSNTTRLTCNTAGLYGFMGQIVLGSTPGDSWWAHIYQNGNRLASAPGKGAYASVSLQSLMAVNDYMELVVQNSTGGSFTPNNGTLGCFFTAAMLGTVA